MKKQRRKRKSNYYFTQDHEDAIVRYAKCDDRNEKQQIYIEYIGPVFNEMVDKIVYTYKFTSLPNIDLLKEECKIWLTTILDKYDSSKGTKAFSYFSVITKNWFIHKVKKHSTQLRREVQYDVVAKDLERRELSHTLAYDKQREEKEFWHYLWTEIGAWEGELLKPNEQKVLNAVKHLLANSDDIEIFNKKAIYLYLRELTDLNTKQVVNNLNKLRVRYRSFKTKWTNGEI